MATSERILTTLTETAAPQTLSRHPHWSEAKTITWGQLGADAITVVLGLSLMPSLLGTASGYRRDILSSVAGALMAATILLFTGAYSSAKTPLNIGATEALVKGLCCAGILTIIGEVYRFDSPDQPKVSLVVMTALLLITQREIVHLIRERTHGERALRSRSGPAKGFSEYESESCAGTLTSATYIDHISVENYSGYLVKRAFDTCSAAILLLVIAPLLLAVTILIKIDSPGPVLLRQRRIGRRGMPFRMWKFRSMYQDVARYARSPISDADPRLTKIGRVLRRFSIDELPQLINVISGEMSLVGPRPEMPFIVAKYKPYERLRLYATPGITGLWQISPARAMPIHDNLEFDLFYIQHRSIFLDIAILLRTVTAVIRGIGAA